MWFSYSLFNCGLRDYELFNIPQAAVKSTTWRNSSTKKQKKNLPLLFFGVIYVQLGGRDKRNLIDFHTLSIIEASPGRIMVETLSRLNSTSSLTSVMQQRSPENHRAYDYLQSVDCFGLARSHTFWESQFSIKVQWTSNAGHSWQHNKVYVDQCCTNILFPSLFTLSQFLLYNNRNKMLCLTWWPWICWNWVSLRLRLHINLTISFF